MNKSCFGIFTAYIYSYNYFKINDTNYLSIFGFYIPFKDIVGQTDDIKYRNENGQVPAPSTSSPYYCYNLRYK